MNMPSVTRALNPFADFSGIPPAVLAHAAERGTKVHAICAALAQGLWAPDIPEECAGYVESFQGWFESRVEAVAGCEIELVDEAIGFEGHPDLICRLKGDERLTLVDLKTPATKNRLWVAQLAAYRHLARLAGFDIDRVGSLRLKKNGAPPIFDEYQHSERYFAAFTSALNAYKFFSVQKGE